MKKLFFIFSIILSIFFISCKTDNPRIYLNKSLMVMSAPNNWTLKDVQKHSSNFNLLQKEDSGRLKKFKNFDDDYIWIKIEFELPEELRNKDLGLYFHHIHAAEKVWLNNVYEGSMGRMPPYDFDAGFGSHYFLLSEEDLNQTGKNQIYIQVWTSILGAVSTHAFIGLQQDVYGIYSLTDFFDSRINTFFIGGLISVFLIFYIIFITQIYVKRTNSYLYFALMNMFTAFFLLPFYAKSITAVRVPGVSYLSFLKIFFFCGAYCTIYFAGLFISAFIDYHPNKKWRIIRFVWMVISILITIFLNNYNSLVVGGLILFFGMFGQIALSIADLIKAFLNPQKNKLAKKLLKGFIPVIIAITADFIIRISTFDTPLPLFTIYGWQITINIFLIYLAYDFNRTAVHNMELSKQLTKFNEHLESEVKSRTIELNEANMALMKNIDQMNKDLETATMVQQGFMPAPNRRFIGWDVAICYKPLEHVSGDLYDYYTTNNQKLDGLGLFDVSGHGTSAGLVTMLSKNIIAQDFDAGRQKSSLSDILLTINQNIISAKSYADRYLTGLLFRFSDFDKHDKCYVELSNAGHPYPLLYSAGTKEVKELKYPDSKQQYGLIGIENLEVSFPNIIFSANIGDVIVCFTDGITEAKDDSGAQFGTSKIKELLPSTNGKTAQEILQLILKKLNEFTKNQPINDDLTIIVLKRDNSEDYIEEI